MEVTYSDFTKRVFSSEIRELLTYSRMPGIISFAGGLPDPCLFPIDDIGRITKDILRENGAMALQYGPTPGEPSFIEALIKHMAYYNESAKPEQICVTSSSQQGLDLVSMVLIDKDAEIIMELPSYLGAIQAFGRAGAIINGIPLSDDGMDLDKLDYTIKKKWKAGIRIRFIYTIPDFQNPAGITMSLQKRRRLIEIARKWEIPLLEDSPYRELSFNNNPLPSLWTLSGGEGVIQLKTFSKMLFPGMRLGWIVAEKEVLNKFILMKQSVDLCSPSFNQLILGRYISEGKMNETIHRASQLYKEKNSFMLSALAQYMPDYVSWSRPEGGMFLWLTMPGYTNSKDLVHLAVEKNVVFVPGGQFHCNKLGNNTLRLNYSYPSLSQIDKGIEGLAGAIQEHCKVKIINCKK